MKLVKLAVHKTRSASDQSAVQANGRIRISPTLAEKMDFHEGTEISVFTDQDDKSFLYVCKGDMYKIFRHKAGSTSSLYFGSLAMFKELGIEEIKLTTLTAALFNINKVLYLRLDISEILPKVKKLPKDVQKEEVKDELNEIQEIEM